jgi:membrane protease YdiL (CAAX protease family)
MSKTHFIERHSVMAYYALVLAIAWGGFLILIGPGGIPGLMAQTLVHNSLFFSVVLVTIAGPILAGILTTIFVHGKEGLHDIVTRLFKWRVGARWYAVALLAAPISVFGTLFALSFFSPAFVPGILTASDKISIIVPALVVSLVGPFCEELGWTGFAIPHVSKRYGILATGVIVGILWGAWHFLSNLWGVDTASQTVPLTLYMLGLLFSFLPPFRVLMVWVYDNTKSLFVAIIMHSSLDFFWLISTPTAIAGVNLMTWNTAWAVVLWVFAGIIVLQKNYPGKLMLETFRGVKK